MTYEVLILPVDAAPEGDGWIPFAVDFWSGRVAWWRVRPAEGV